MTWLRFETIAVEDEAATRKEGRLVMRDQDRVILMIDERSEIPMTIERAQRDQKLWPDIEPKYERWKRDGEVPLDGYPLKEWPQVTAAQFEMFRRLHVLTVEALADAPDNILERFGPGARALQQKAQAWLQAGAGTGKLAEEIRQLQEDRENDRRRIAELEELLSTATAPDEADDIEPPRQKRAYRKRNAA